MISQGNLLTLKGRKKNLNKNVNKKFSKILKPSGEGVPIKFFDNDNQEVLEGVEKQCLEKKGVLTTTKSHGGVVALQGQGWKKI